MNKLAWTYVGGAMYQGDYENGDLLFSFGDESIARDVENGHITWDEFKPSEDVARVLTIAPELLEALRKAVQLASIASDWNLDEVEIDGEMVATLDLWSEFKECVDRATGAKA